MTTGEPAPILILGGTSEATELARELTARGRNVILSLAGRTNPAGLPSLPARRRTGGFGGVPGLVAELRQLGRPLLVDATHPFAVGMAQNAVAAAGVAGVPHVRLLRPPWQPIPGAPWIDVAHLDEAATRLREFRGRRAFLAIGSRHLDAFAGIDDVELVLRSIEPPESVPTHLTVILARGPFAVDDELALLREQSIDVIVARNSGGQATMAKLEAARRLAIPVIMIRRPEQPEGAQVSTVDDALLWVEATLSAS